MDEKWGRRLAWWTCQWLTMLIVITSSPVGAAPSSIERMLFEVGNGASTYSNTLNKMKLGLDEFKAGRYVRAIDHLNQLSLDEVNTKDLVTYFLAESYFHSGSFEQAEEILSTFKDRFPASKWRDFARARYGDVLRAQKRPEASLAIYQDLIDNHRDYPHPGALKLSIAAALEGTGDSQGAADYLHRFVVEFPKNVYRAFAGQHLKRLGRLGFKPAAIDFDTSIDIAISLRIRRLHDDGLNWVRQLQQRSGLTEKQRWTAQYHEARMLLNGRQFRRSIELFETLGKTATSSKLRLRTHKWRSRAFEGLGQVEAAVKQQSQYWQATDFLSPARRAARGELYLRHGQFGKAADWFSNLTLKRSRQGRRLRVLKPIAEFAGGRPDKAKSLFDTYFESGFGGELPLTYWRARIDAATKDKDAALKGYTSLVRNHKGYYAEQARARLREHGVSIEDEWRVSPNSVDESMDSRVKALFGEISTEGDRIMRLGAVAELVKVAGAAFPDLKDVFELLFVGREDDAIWHLRKVTSEVLAWRAAPRWKRSKWAYRHRELLDYRRGPKRGPWGDVREGEAVRASKARVKSINALDLKRVSEQLAFLFETLGDYYFVIKLLNRTPKKVDSNDPPSRRQMELRYPKAYRAIVEKEAKAYDIEPYIMWALMRTESHFNTLAISPAEARGLMQVIWQTSQRISESGGFVDLGNAQILLPRVSIALGAYYVSSLLKKFAGQLPFAFAGYNAGPHRVSAWLDRKPDMKMDQFIEEIQYEEARAYVKKVLEALLTYRRLYEGGAGEWIGQSINRKYGAEPDF
ncbi:MAG: transglycosylase SLT domain-containing protein [Bradymonadia bacterium]